MKIKLKVNSYDDREKIVSGLANSGYSVKVEKVSDGLLINKHDYYVIFELPKPQKDNKE